MLLETQKEHSLLFQAAIVTRTRAALTFSQVSFYAISRRVKTYRSQSINNTGYAIWKDFYENRQFIAVREMFVVRSTRQKRI